MNNINNYILTKQKAEEYYARSAETAIYPDGMIYVCLGLCGEAGELFDEINAYNIDKIKQEIGDLFWYIAAFYRENPDVSDFVKVNAIISKNENLKLMYEPVETDFAYVILQYASRIAEYMKKLLRLKEMREGEIKQNKITDIIENMFDVIEDITKFLFRSIAYYKIPIDEILDYNIEKLSQRKLSGTLMSR